MSIETAQQRVVELLPNLDVDLFDNAKQIRPEGNLLVLEGITVTDMTETTYVFGLYVAKKVLNKDSTTIYGDLNYIAETMQRARLDSQGYESAGLRGVLQNGFENGILEYRCELFVTESNMVG